MSRTGPTRTELVAAIIAQGRTNSTGTVLLHAAIAERLGLNPSDHKCADLMMSQSEPCTPGRLSELTGLSTGAITGVTDRLERAGFLVREHDAQDRRRVLLRLTHTRAPELQALFAPLARGVEALCDNYTVGQLAVVLRYMREVQLVTEEIAHKLRNVPGLSEVRGEPPQLPEGEASREVGRVGPLARRSIARASAAKRRAAPLKERSKRPSDAKRDRA